mgnify:CR=1 FL=1
MDNEKDLNDTTLSDEDIPAGFTEEGLETVEEEEPSEDIDINHAQRIIEAVLFAAGYPVSYEKLGRVLETTAGTAKSIVRHYADIYNDEVGIPRGIQLVMFDAACQICTREQYGAYVREALGIRRGGNLSQSSIETLAIIAYNEPVTRAFIDTVRGVDSSYAVSSLTEKQLIASCGHLDVPGRPRLYKTTDNFLRVFGLSSLSELPEISVPTAIQETIPVDSPDHAKTENVETGDPEAGIEQNHDTE